MRFPNYFNKNNLIEIQIIQLCLVFKDFYLLFLSHNIIRLAHRQFLPIWSYHVPIVVDMILGLTWDLLGSFLGHVTRFLFFAFFTENLERIIWLNKVEDDYLNESRMQLEDKRFCLLIRTSETVVSWVLSFDNPKRKCVFLLDSARLFVPLILRILGTSARKNSNKFGFSLAYSYL